MTEAKVAISSQQRKVRDRRYFPLAEAKSFVFTNRFRIALYSLPASLISCWVIIFMTDKNLELSKQFILQTLSSAGYAWMYGAIFITAFLQASKQKNDTLSCAKQALIFLPKVFLSFFFVELIVGVFIGLIWSLVFQGSALLAFPVLASFVFLVWAPAFCVGEIFTKDLPDDDVDETDLEEIEKFFKEKAKRRYESYFSEKSIFDFGIGRSITFVKSNFALTFKVLALMVFCNVVLAAIFFFLGAEKHSLLGFLNVITSTLVSAYIVGIAAVVFIDLLSDRAKRELSIEPNKKLFFTTAEETTVEVTKALPHRLLILVCVGIFFYCSYYLGVNLPGFGKMPEGAIQNVNNPEIEGESVKIRFTVKDPEKKLKWLSWIRFKGQFSKNEVTSSTQLLDILGTEEFVPVASAKFFGKNDKIISSQEGFIGKDEVDIELKFKKPKWLKPGVGKLQIFYMSLFDAKEPVIVEKF